MCLTHASQTMLSLCCCLSEEVIAIYFDWVGFEFRVHKLHFSPVDKWHKQYSSLIFGAWVPFPAPAIMKRLISELKISLSKRKKNIYIYIIYYIYITWRSEKYRPCLLFLTASKAALELPREFYSSNFRELNRHLWNTSNNKLFLAVKYCIHSDIVKNYFIKKSINNLLHDAPGDPMNEILLYPWV